MDGRWPDVIADTANTTTMVGSVAAGWIQTALATDAAALGACASCTRRVTGSSRCHRQQQGHEGMVVHSGQAVPAPEQQQQWV